MRIQLSESDSFRDVVMQLADHAVDASEHQDISLEEIVDYVQPERVHGVNPLFQVMFVLQNLPVTELSMPPLMATSTRSFAIDHRVSLGKR